MSDPQPQSEPSTPLERLADHLAAIGFDVDDAVEALKLGQWATLAIALAAIELRADDALGELDVLQDVADFDLWRVAVQRALARREQSPGR